MADREETTTPGWRGLRQLREQLDHDSDLLGPSDTGMDALMREQEADIVQSLAPGRDAGSGNQPITELRSAKYFRDGLANFGVEQAVTASAQRAHPESGPLNPEKLVVHSLSVMRELSPSYVKRFVAYVDTLFWLEQTGKRKAPQD